MNAGLVLTFTTHRLSWLFAWTPASDTTLRTLFARTDRAKLIKHASAIHATTDQAWEYGHREGPVVMLTPEGAVHWIERLRCASADARVAEMNREYADLRGAEEVSHG